jgi:hypothetical protein
MTELHIIPDERTTWRIYASDALAALSEHTNATAAEFAARAHAEDCGVQRVVIHDRYHRTRVAAFSPCVRRSPIPSGSH